MNSAHDARLILSSSVSFRVLSPDVVEATIGGVTGKLPMTLYQLALEFTSPRRVADVYAGLDTEGGMDDIATLLAPLLERGVLAPEDTRDPSLHSVLHPRTFADPSLLPRIGRAITEGRAVVIPDAFDEALAERTHAALERSTLWQPYARPHPYFNYRHHNLYDAAHFPPEIREVQRVLDSRSAKTLLGELTGCDCSAPLNIGASLYLPGDYSLPHTDAMGARSIAYVWYLTRDWKPEWGGQFVWCPTGALMNPTFNSLVLFRVSASSLHFVAPVAPQARSRRMAVNGWWESKTFRRAVPSAEGWRVPLAPGAYGERTSTLEGRDDIILL